MHHKRLAWEWLREFPSLSDYSGAAVPVRVGGGDREVNFYEGSRRFSRRGVGSGYASDVCAEIWILGICWVRQPRAKAQKVPKSLKTNGVPKGT